jgi:copper chaperone CopZ
MFKTNSTTLTIEGMTCGNCVAHVTKAISSVSGVKKTTVDLDAKTAVIKHKGVDMAAVMAAVAEAGYTASNNQ